ncbi:MAG: hypothetical protein M1823_007127, partial [Watsoniomyces obsoletus]
LNTLSYVRHIRVSVFETSREAWELPLDKFPGLKSITFAPWQKGWTIDIPEREDSPALSDASIMEEVHRVLAYKDGYEPVRNLINGKRDFKVLKKWQLKTWRADFDANTIDRSWQEVMPTPFWSTSILDSAANFFQSSVEIGGSGICFSRAKKRLSSPLSCSSLAFCDSVALSYLDIPSVLLTSNASQKPVA